MGRNNKPDKRNNEYTVYQPWTNMKKRSWTQTHFVLKYKESKIDNAEIEEALDGPKATEEHSPLRGPLWYLTM